MTDEHTPTAARPIKAVWGILDDYWKLHICEKRVKAKRDVWGVFECVSVTVCFLCFYWPILM